MEARVARLEAMAEKTSERLAALDKDVAVLLSRSDGFATKSDLASAETSIIKWLVGTAIAIGGLAFAIARFIH